LAEVQNPLVVMVVASVDDKDNGRFNLFFKRLYIAKKRIEKKVLKSSVFL
jgi:hypothetical protein